jgi:hypothetical protein
MRILNLKASLTSMDGTCALPLQYRDPLFLHCGSIDTFAPLLMWSTTELNLSIICACAASLKPLLRRYLPALLGSSNHASDAMSNSNSGRRTGTSFPLSAMGTRAGGALATKVSRGGGGDGFVDTRVFNVEIAQTTEVLVTDDGAKSLRLSEDGHGWTKGKGEAV